MTSPGFLRLILIIAVSVLVPSASFAEDSLRLTRAVELALQNDNAWSAARQRFLATQQALPLARSTLLPNIVASGSYGRTHRETTQLNNTASRQFNQDVIRVQLRQPLINLERVYQVRIAQRDVNVGELELQLARQDVMQRVVSAYFELLLAQEQVFLSESQVAAIEEQKGQAERLREGGVATLTDVHEAQARLDRARADSIAALNGLQISQRQLHKIIGERVGSVVPLDENARLFPPEPNDIDAWVQEAIEGAIVVLARDVLAEQAALNVDRARSQHLPTLNLFASYDRSSNTDLGLAKDKIGRVGVELNIPLYSGGGINAQTREAAARRNQATEELLLARREAELETSTAFSELTNALARISALEEAVRSGEVALEAAQISFSVAYRTFIDVLNAQQQLYGSRFELLRARFDYVQAVARLNASVGALDESVIHQIDFWLQKTEQ